MRMCILYFITNYQKIIKEIMCLKKIKIFKFKSKILKISLNIDKILMKIPDF